MDGWWVGRKRVELAILGKTNSDRMEGKWTSEEDEVLVEVFNTWNMNRYG